MDFKFSSQGRKNAQNLEEREKLLEVIQKENEVLTQLAEKFYATVNRGDETCVEYSKSIIEIVDRILAAGDWDSSLFLRNMIAPIKKIRSQAKEILFSLGSQESDEDETLQLAEGERLVYVSLFQARGESLPHWELQLKSITGHLVSRPVYESEKAIQRSLRGSVNTVNSGYAILRILDSDIDEFMVGDDQRYDRFGQKLIVIKSGHVDSENIVGFVHEKKEYLYRQGKLIYKKV